MTREPGHLDPTAADSGSHGSAPPLGGTRIGASIGEDRAATPHGADATGRTGPGRQRTGERISGGGPAVPAAFASAWTDYLAATRQLDAVRRGATTAAGEQARSVQAAREELTTVRARLAPQQSRLRELGVPPMSLVPAPPEVSEAARSMASGPAAVLRELRAARAAADAADAVLDGRRVLQPRGWPPRTRNLLVYGPSALVGPLLQLLLLLLAGDGTPAILALLCGLPVAVVSFVVGWISIDHFFAPAVGEGVERSTGFGALVCMVPAALTTIVVSLVLLLR